MIQFQRGYSCIMTNLIQRQASRSYHSGLKETLGPVQLLRAPLPEGPCMIQTKASEEHSGHEAYHWLIIIYCSRCCCFMFHNASSLNILRYRYDLVINTRFDNFIYILCHQQKYFDNVIEQLIGIEENQIWQKCMPHNI